MNERGLVLDFLAILKSHVTDPFLMGQIARSEDDIDLERPVPDFRSEAHLFADYISCSAFARCDHPEQITRRHIYAAVMVALADRELWAVTPPPYDPDEIPNQGRGTDLARTEGDDAPELAAAAGTQGEPDRGVDGPVGHDHGGAAGEPEPTLEGDGASEPPHAAPSFIVGAHHNVREDRSRSIGVEDHSAFPVGEWTRLYVPTARLDECIAALDALPDSDAHAPDPVDDTTTELGPLDDITYRSTGRNAYDVIRTRAEGPDTVLATVLFSEGVRGRVHGLEALVRSLRQTVQDVQP